MGEEWLKIELNKIKPHILIAILSNSEKDILLYWDKVFDTLNKFTKRGITYPKKHVYNEGFLTEIENIYRLNKLFENVYPSCKKGSFDLITENDIKIFYEFKQISELEELRYGFSGVNTPHKKIYGVLEDFLKKKISNNETINTPIVLVIAMHYFDIVDIKTALYGEGEITGFYNLPNSNLVSLILFYEISSFHEGDRIIHRGSYYTDKPINPIPTNAMNLIVNAIIDELI
ncbi:MAG: hypothetical protein ACXQTP_04585 [Candidatus Methanofastidiosia archaeon]